MSLLAQALAHDHKGYSEEQCIRCGWVMGERPLNCQNNDTPHQFLSQLPCTDPDCLSHPHHLGALGCVDEAPGCVDEADCGPCAEAVRLGGPLARCAQHIDALAR